MIAAALLAVAAFCAGYWAAPEPQTDTVTVRVPVPVECRVSVPDRPAMPTDAFTAAPDVDQYTQASMAEIEVREAYEIRMRAALAVCTAPIAP